MLPQPALCQTAKAVDVWMFQRKQRTNRKNWSDADFPTARRIRLPPPNRNRSGASVQTAWTMVASGLIGPPGPGRTSQVEIRRDAPNMWIDGTKVLVSWHSPNRHWTHPIFD
jgi:hypothetical protein